MVLAPLVLTLMAASPTLPAGYWPEEKASAVLAKTQSLRLGADLSELTERERDAVQLLLQAGDVVQRVYEDMRHPEALRARAALEALDKKLGSPKRTQDLRTLYRLAQGPVVSNLDNALEPFLPVRPLPPGRNVYPLDATREELDAYLAKHPAARERLLAERAVVRRATREALRKDLASLRAHPGLALLHAGLAGELEALAKKPDAKAFYAVPYAVAYAAQVVQVHGLVTRAAALVAPTDPELAGYLRLRARDLLTDDYEGGDAAWVTGRFGHLNVQLGAFETYDDALYGVKAFPSLSVLVKAEKATERVHEELGSLQALEDALPYPAPHKRVKSDISVGVYDVVADFAQARGTNTASILPNDPEHARKYGRTILLRRNIMENPELFAQAQRTWRAAVAPAHADALTPEAGTQRTLWHEVGHYLGPDRDGKGRTLDVALEDQADAMEELKSDLVSLFVLHRLRANDAPALQALQASGVLRTLQNARPRKDQPYQTMQLAQFNYFLAHGLLKADAEARLTLDAGRYAEVVGKMLQEVLALQQKGERAAAAAFLERWGAWTPELHERLAARIREAQGPRYRLVKDAVMGEK